MKGLLLEKSTKMNVQSVLDVYNKLDAKLDAEGINKSNLCSYVMIIFGEVNKYKKLTEEERKEIIISMLNKLIRKVESGDEDSELEILLMSLVPNLVDSLFFTINASSKLKKLLCCVKA